MYFLPRQAEVSCHHLCLSFLLASGVKNADENELKAIASPPEETHVYNVADFSVMSDIVEGLTKTICDRVDQLDKQIKGWNLEFQSIKYPIIRTSVKF